ncbi:GyrI-like domain-containing protein [Actinoplanes sp. NPDC051633]|uniref:GyrI-like domain-containing protein n=1 Tax=Actinoplanes sp. NPDC051633 TaxID=3155670 RepID=UPI00341C2F14
MTEISTRDVPALRVVTEVRVVDQQQLMEWLPGAMARVGDAPGGLDAASQPWLGRDTGDPVFVVVYEGNPNEAPCEVVVGRPVAEGGDRELPAHHEAFARVRKATVLSGGLGEVYEGIEKWAGDQGLTVLGPPREVYWTDFGAASEDDVVFDVAWPVAQHNA